MGFLISFKVIILFHVLYMQIHSQITENLWCKYYVKLYDISYVIILNMHYRLNNIELDEEHAYNVLVHNSNQQNKVYAILFISYSDCLLIFQSLVRQSLSTC